jgi:hypothetical protein
MTIKYVVRYRHMHFKLLKQLMEQRKKLSITKYGCFFYDDKLWKNL